MSLITDVAQKVVDVLNDHTFGQTFTAERSYLPVFSLPEMADLHVTVIPRDLTVEAANRKQDKHDCHVDIGVQKKLTKSDNDEIDQLMDLTEEIAVFFRGKKLDAPANATCVKVQYRPVYSPEHLNEYRQFTAVLTLTFRTWR